MAGILHLMVQLLHTRTALLQQRGVHPAPRMPRQLAPHSFPEKQSNCKAAQSQASVCNPAGGPLLRDTPAQRGAVSASGGRRARGAVGQRRRRGGARCWQP